VQKFLTVALAIAMYIFDSLARTVLGTRKRGVAIRPLPVHLEQKGPLEDWIFWITWTGSNPSFSVATGKINGKTVVSGPLVEYDKEHSWVKTKNEKYSLGEPKDSWLKTLESLDIELESFRRDG